MCPAGYNRSFNPRGPPGIVSDRTQPAPPAPEHTVKLSAAEFRAWPNKRITLLGMSGVGKTRLSNMLRKRNWFHYSGDYRIGTRYLDEPILDNIKHKAMEVPFLRDLLRTDSIYIVNNITVDNLQPVSSFLGKLGNPEQGGLGLKEFKYRQELHRVAEIAAMRDVPEFIRKAQAIYGYQHFVNDAGGSVCELDDPQTIDILAEHTLILYLKATKADEVELIRRAEADPKPLYYREAFLDEQLQHYMLDRGLPYVALIDPDDFVRWMFPRLFYSRIPRYEAIAQQHGYTVTTTELAQVQDEAGFMRLIEAALERQG
jgi:shikimate kinase